MTCWRILEPVPADSLPWAVQAVSDVQRECELDTWGFDDLWGPVWVWNSILGPSPDTRRRLFVAVPEGLDEPAADDVAGVAVLHLPQTGNHHLGHVDVLVRPGVRRQGVGSALATRAEQALADEGRTVAISYVASTPEPPAGPDALEPPTGTGRIPAHAPSTRLALRHGYRLEQVSRHSVLTVPDDLTQTAAARDAALAVAGEEYRLHVWHDDVPSQWRAGMADLLSRMLSDIPTGDLSYGDDLWDVARVERWLATYTERAMHVTLTVAEHTPTGTLTAFTELAYPQPEVPFAFQEGTLVRADHRGRRLGMAVKAQNLLAVRERRPGLRRIHTDNAQENSFMLAINVALGFAPAGVWAAWQKKL